MKKTAALKRKPELKFLDCDHDQIMKKHVNDFKGLTTQNLTLEEARALYGCMPEFRKDQEAQLQFAGQLKDKIETEIKKPKVRCAVLFLYLNFSIFPLYLLVLLYFVS
jgi:hypothetical protein